ncbi:MAG: hypothetical protein ABF289_08590 [Clostridiales bacterium]
MKVLKLISMEQKNSNIIADLLGLKENYIDSIKKILKSYKYINGSITEKGNEVLKLGQKKLTQTKIQKFQFDILNEYLLKTNKLVSIRSLKSSSETDKYIGHLDYTSEVFVDIEKIRLDLLDYKTKDEQIIHINAKNITGCKVSEVNYTESCLIKFKYFEEIVVFIESYDKSRENYIQRFSWRPVSIKSKKLKNFFETDIVKSTDTMIKQVNLLYEIIQKEKEKFKIRDYEYKLNKDYFNKIKVYLNEKNNYCVDINKYNLLKNNHLTLNILLEFAKNGEYLMLRNFLKGNILYLKPEGNNIKEISKILFKYYTKNNMKFKEEFYIIYGKYNSEIDGNLIDFIKQFFSKSTNEKY